MNKPSDVLSYKWLPKSLYDEDVSGKEALVCNVIIGSSKDCYIMVG